MNKCMPFKLGAAKVQRHNLGAASPQMARLLGCTEPATLPMGHI